MQSTQTLKEKLTKSRPTKQCQQSGKYAVWNLSLIAAATSLSDENWLTASIEHSIAFFVIVDAISELLMTGLGRGWLMVDIFDKFGCRGTRCSLKRM